MNPESIYLPWLGDTYDIVKKYYISILKDCGYKVYISPMFIGIWESNLESYLDFLGVIEFTGFPLAQDTTGWRTALFYDCTKGLRRRFSNKHVVFNEIEEDLNWHKVVMVFDQSFPRYRNTKKQMREKLERIHEYGAHGFYYYSHAPLLFAAKDSADFMNVYNAIIKSGIPESRLVLLEKA